jgi:hypothetical protein
MLIAGLAIALLLGACSTSSPAGSGSPSSAGAPTADLAKAARDQLCNAEGGGSLSKVATQLDDLSKADTAQLQATLGTLLLNLQQLQVDDTTKPIRDAAGTAVLGLQNALNDPTKRQEAGTKAAAALRAVEVGICK